MARRRANNKLTSPELLAQVNKENMRLLDDFLDYLKSVKRSETTIYVYKNDIEIAWVWSLQFNDNKFFVDWTKRNIVAYQNWLIETNNQSPARVRRLRSTLSSLSNYISNVLDDEYPNFRNIVSKIEAPAGQPVREKTVWTEEELLELLDFLIEKGRVQRACYLALGMYSGRRKAELCRFKVSDFDDDKLICDGALYKSAPIRTKGRGDGKYINCYTLAKKFKPYLDIWMAERQAQGIESEWLFPKKSNPAEHIETYTVDSWVTYIKTKTDKPMYIHSLRHFFTTMLARAGLPDSVIQSIVAWETSDMVRLYTDIDVDEQIGMFFKDGEISVPEQKGFGDL